MWQRVVWSLLGLSTLSCLFAQKADDYKVTSLPGFDHSLLPNQYAGHIPIASESNGHLFFWMVDQKHIDRPKKLIMWLNGGPGCSSMDGFFLENGPVRVNENLTLSQSPGGWHDSATTVFLDQPVGTGFSFADTISYTHNLTQVAKDFTIFLDNFFHLFPHLEAQDLYLAGESYAGTYLPYIASHLLDVNRYHNKYYRLKGVAIGNGWISPIHQYNAIYDFSMQHNLLNANYKTLATKHLARCHTLLGKSDRISIDTCEQVMGDVLDSSVHERDNKKYCINQYDIRLKDEESPSCGMAWPKELNQMTRYLRLPQLVNAIHSRKQAMGWVECSSSVYNALEDDMSKPSYELLPAILKEIPVMLFSGEYDLTCNHVGTEYLIGNMTWNGKKGFQRAKPVEWYLNDKVVGYYTKERNLTYVLVKDSSHMVPYDKPLEALDMMNRFIGTGDSSIHGTTSHVGDFVEPLISSPVSPSTPPSIPSSFIESDTQPSPADASSAPEEKEEDAWSQYYSWGTSALIVTILLAALFAYCWYQSKKQESSSGYHSTGQQQQPTGIIAFVMQLFGKKTKRKPNLRLDDPYEDNELDELVVETPTLFAVEEDSDNEDHVPSHHATESTFPHRSTTAANDSANTKRNHTVNEEDDDDFDDFADWDEGTTLNHVDHKAEKNH
ncbi:Alpha/Beta hydrolase protein [Spinellus fusiger]|nr:Alpha/Beta hydrolase protein [Spinellus fusiger]